MTLGYAEKVPAVPLTGPVHFHLFDLGSIIYVNLVANMVFPKIIFLKSGLNAYQSFINPYLVISVSIFTMQ